mgnify:CR=1 FL=1
MNVIIVGCGNVGSTVAETLSHDRHSIVVVDLDKSKVDLLTDEHDVLGVVGDGLNYQVLLKAGIEHTDLLVATMNSDEQNLLCCVMAKRSDRYCRTIARVRNPIYNTEISYLRRELGLAMIINPEYISASDIARKFQYPDSVTVETFTRGRIELLHVTVAHDSLLDGISVGSIRNKWKCDVVICAVRRGTEVFIPGQDSILETGDELTISATPGDAAAFFKKAKLYENRIRSCIIVGSGNVGYYLAKRLTDGGIRTKIVESDVERCDLINEEIPRAIVIHGDGTDERLLLREGLGGVGAFAALTGIDEENVLLTNFAMRVSHAKTITKLNRVNYSDISHNVNPENAVFPGILTAEYILKYARAMLDAESSFGNAYEILDGDATMLEFFVLEENEVTGTAISQLRMRGRTILCAITRDDRLMIPTGRDEIRVGDNVFLLTLEKDVNRISDVMSK